MNDRAHDNLVRGAQALGVTLLPVQVAAFERFCGELKKWSAKINLTAITDDEEIVAKHFLDSLTLLKIGDLKGSLADIGSGAGFPAIPLKIVVPGLAVTSLEAVGKKTIFQRHAARLLGLEGFVALHVRAERVSVELRRSFDWVVSRAFADFSTFIRIAAPLIREDGTIVAMKGRGAQREAEEAEGCLASLGLRVVDILEFDLPISGERRGLVLIRSC